MENEVLSVQEIDFSPVRAKLRTQPSIQRDGGGRGQ